jgi:hypothetical protein
MQPSEPDSAAGFCHRHFSLLLAALLLLSLALRVWLASTGGQGYWADEMRYSATTNDAAWQFTHGAPRDGWIALIGTADHLLFKIVGLPAALWELRHGDNPTLVASYFGLFSVFAIALVCAVARSAGASRRESLLAGLFAATANSLFYYSRHFFPYDLALALCLLGQWLALGRDAWWRSLGAGLAAGLGFLAYNGYWLLSAIVLIFHTLRGVMGWQMLKRASLAGVGLLAPIVAVVVGAKMLNHDLIASFRAFSGTVTLGDFGRGWIFVWQYLWAAEGGLLVVWLLLSVGGLLLVRSRRAPALRYWFGFTIILYAGLIICADVGKVFVVYGRTARMVVPFLCLAAAAGADGLAVRWSWRWGGTVLLGITTILGMRHMGEALRQVFPREFLELAKERAKVARTESPALLRVLNADLVYVGSIMTESRPNDVLLQRRRPLQFKPFLFEGLTEERRGFLATQNLAMRLIAVPSASLPDIGSGYPGPLRLRVKFPTDRSGGEPLIASGETGRANFVYVQYTDPRHIRIGYDCWIRGGPLSSPIEIDYAREHELLVSCGAQLPPGVEPPAGVDAIAWARLQGQVIVAVDGITVLSGSVAMHPTSPQNIFLGMNVVGGSTASELFSGDILSVERAPWADVLKRMEPEWAGFPGPMRLRVRLPLGGAGTAEPLIVSGVTGGGDFVFVRYHGDGRVSFGFDHWGAGGPESKPIAVGKNRKVEIVTSHGGLMPPGGASVYARSPALAALRESVLISVDGQVVVRAVASAHPSKFENITFGRNLIGGSTTVAKFTGTFESMKLEPAELVLGQVGSNVAVP